MKENAKQMEAVADSLRNHLSGPPIRSLCAFRNANAPMLRAISTKSREIGRKLSGPRTSGETPISPNAPSARPCSDSSHALPRPEFHTPAMIAHAPATIASALISQAVFRDAFTSSIRRFNTAIIASAIPHNARSHQILRSIWNTTHLCVHHTARANDKSSYSTVGLRPLLPLEAE